MYWPWLPDRLTTLCRSRCCLKAHGWSLWLFHFNCRYLSKRTIYTVRVLFILSHKCSGNISTFCKLYFLSWKQSLVLRPRLIINTPLNSSLFHELLFPMSNPYSGFNGKHYVAPYDKCSLQTHVFDVVGIIWVRLIIPVSSIGKMLLRVPRE